MYPDRLPPFCLAEAVRMELAGESILWSARPDRGVSLRRLGGNLGGLVFISLFLTFWFWGAFHASNRGVISGWIFIAFGVWLGAAFVWQALKPVWDELGEGRIFYVVADRRAVIFHKKWRVHIQSFEARGFEGFERESQGGTSGSIIFRRLYIRRAKGSTRVDEIGFLNLASYAEAETALREMMRRNSAAV
jgi:hypothetical protein